MLQLLSKLQVLFSFLCNHLLMPYSSSSNAYSSPLGQHFVTDDLQIC